MFPEMLAFYLAYKEYNKEAKIDHLHAPVKCKEMYVNGEKVK